MKYLISAFFILFMISCGKPSWVLSEKQMEDVLFDVHIAESVISENYQEFKTDEEKQKLFESIYNRHGITRAELDTSLFWYGRHLDKLDKIYQRLEERYTVESGTLSARIEREAKLKEMPDLNYACFWEDQPVHLLSSYSSNENKLRLNLDTVELFNGKKYKLTYNLLGVSDSIVAPTVTLSAKWQDSTIYLNKETNYENGLCAIYFSVGDSAILTYRLSALIRVPVNYEYHPVTIYGIKLYRDTLSNEVPISPSFPLKRIEINK